MKSKIVGQEKDVHEKEIKSDSKTIRICNVEVYFLLLKTNGITIIMEYKLNLKNPI